MFVDGEEVIENNLYAVGSTVGRANRDGMQGNRLGSTYPVKGTARQYPSQGKGTVARDNHVHVRKHLSKKQCDRIVQLYDTRYAYLDTYIYTYVIFCCGFARNETLQNKFRLHRPTNSWHGITEL